MKLFSLTLFFMIVNSITLAQDFDYEIDDSISFLVGENDIAIQQLDTVYTNEDSTYQIGHFLVNADSTISALKIGLWKEYYENGQLKSEGKFQVDWYWFCSTKAIQKYYLIKHGTWYYYHKNGTIKAFGDYNVKSVHTRLGSGGCKSSKYIFYPDRSWRFYKENGQKLKFNQKLKKEFQFLDW